VSQNSEQTFGEDESGALLPFTIIIFLLVFAAAGMGADFMRHEMYRANLQNALDRGVLAATAFSQEEDPTNVVTEFVQQSPRWNGTGELPQITITQDPPAGDWFNSELTERSLTANASVGFRTHFLRLVGIPTLDVNVRAASAQTRKFVEIVMVLDISASMDGLDNVTNQAKIYGMREAAKNFVNSVVTSETRELTSVTLVPFGGTVNSGDFTDYMSLNESDIPSWMASSPTGVSYCPEFEASDFAAGNEEILNLGRGFDISNHFKYYGNTGPNTQEVRWAWCPESNAGIVAMTNEPNEITARIDSMPLYDGTGIDVALKWGLFSLSPESRPAIQNMVSDGIVPSEFGGRPLDFNDDDVEKYMVFLTDGGITEQFQVIDELWDGTVNDLATRDIFQNDTQRTRVLDHITSVVGAEGLLADYWSAPDTTYHSGIFNRVLPRLNKVDDFEGTVRARTNNNVSRIRGAREERWDIETALEHTTQLCDFMSADRGDGQENVRVFTIGFNIAGLDFATYDPDTQLSDLTNPENNLQRSAYVLNYCATSTSDRYLADGASLDEAFDGIASQINSLRLTN